ncbi:hypothetical protein PBPRB0797 [Photobacterium profundum SS9]|uniref:Uncharacterized protein n=1 Tax=Photobacterium profundum (strain SS9) TaxID=298386 RepID=Q6LJ61_PHOPR|nr:hypothetical protein PBPRB0797 [Photobacterium profundum SS9]
MYFPPSQLTVLLATASPTRLCRRSTRFCPPHHYWLSLAESYSLLRVHLPPRTNVHFESPLNGRFRRLPGCGVRLPQLLRWLPVRNSTLKHDIGLTKYWASRYFGRLPTNTAETGYG